MINYCFIKFLFYIYNIINQTNKIMTFYNHCNIKLYNEASRIIELTTWANVYKEQTLDNVADELEKGRMIRTNHGGYTVPFNTSDVKGIVNIVANRD